MITGDQIRAARGLVRMEQATLAQNAGVSVETIKRLEKMDGPLSGAKPATVDAIRRALEDTGVEFTNGGRPGISVKWPIQWSIKILAAYVMRNTFIIDSTHTLDEQAARKAGIVDICKRLIALADLSREQSIKLTDFEDLHQKLRDLETYPTNEQVSAVVQAFQAAERRRGGP